ncbi:MAG: hypothetical protein KA928_02220 [Longilinea sp.]|nr:hypothetical protein [Longilinea sp.]
MKTVSCPAWFAWLVSLYPAEFRETFGPEMLAVFTAKLTAARNESRRAMLAASLHELSELPGNLLTEHWHNLKKGGIPMVSTRRLVFTGLAIPLGVAVFLVIINPNYMLNLFTGFLGWLAVISFLLLILLNGVLIWRGQRQDHPSPGWVVGLTLAALLCIFLGPTLNRVSGMLPPIWTTVITIVLILVSLGCISVLATLFLKAQRTS